MIWKVALILLLSVVMGASGCSGDIHRAALRGNTHKVRRFLQEGVDPDVQNEQPIVRNETHLTPMMYAAAGGHMDVIRVLFEAGADPEARDKGDYTPLHYAAVFGRPDVVEFLLDRGVDVDVRTGARLTPLIMAARYGGDHSSGHAQVLELLLARGADVNAVDVTGQTALHEARRWERGTELLLAAGADVAVIDNYGDTPLTKAVHYGGRTAVVNLLLAHGAEHNIFTAVGLGMTDLVTEMLDEAPDLLLARRGPGNHTLLHLAVRKGEAEVISALIARGADVNALGRVGETPLYSAVRHGNVEVVRLLLSHGADPNLDETERKITPLHWAAMRGHKDVARRLLEHGADVNARDYRGRTPLRVARFKVMGLLERRGGVR